MTARKGGTLCPRPWGLGPKPQGESFPPNDFGADLSGDFVPAPRVTFLNSEKSHQKRLARGVPLAYPPCFVFATTRLTQPP